MDSEYQEIEKTEDPFLKNKYWKTGFGLNRIDGLMPSEYLTNKLMPEHLSGNLNYEEIEDALKNYYQTNLDDEELQNTKECDIVSTRIANILDNSGFILSPATLKGIHRFLFDGILPESWVGSFRETNIRKAEPILDGDSVSYANYFMIEETLQYDFETEKKKNYLSMDDRKMVQNISDFTSSIWQVHPFREGNTRTVAVFLVQYLNSKGFEINNKPFEDNALYFRSSLVRANYSNREKLIEHNDEFLNKFFENLLTKTNHELNNDDLLISINCEWDLER